VVDLTCSVGLTLLLMLLAGAYLVRVAFSGAASFDRVRRDKGSALLGMSAMQMGYWGLDPVGRGLASLGVSANSISATSLLLGLGAAAALAAGHFGVAAVLATFGALGDALDGMVARYTKTASDSGEVLDASIDRYVEFTFLGGLAIYDHDRPLRLAVALAAILGSFMVSYATAKSEAMAVLVPRGSMRRPERAAYLTLAAALCPFTALWASRGGPSWVAEAPMIFATTLVAVVGNVSAVRRLRAVARSLRARDARQVSTLRESDADESVASRPSTKEAVGPSAAVTRTGPSEVRRAANG
jgi:CDP-diacylglycerol---glycerol-3-phosphate 3-phosphatidyltransferase